jgi:AraC-like DNA-binding protein
MFSTRKVPPALGMAPKSFVDTKHIQNEINTQDDSLENFAGAFGQFRNLSAMFRNKTGSKVNDGKMKFSEALNSNNPISELFFRLAFSSPSYFISILLPVFSSLICTFIYIQLSA